MRINAVSYILVGAALVGISRYSSFCGRTEGPSQADTIESTIRQLSASDHAVREAAKHKMIQIGDPAVRPLITLLKDIIEHHPENYALGKTKADLDQAMKRAESIDSDSSDKAEAVREVTGILINHRLEGDVCEVLGLLQAEEGIPVLIEAMEHSPSGSDWETMNAAMIALIRIGQPAVLKIIEAIETAKERAAETPYGEGQPSDFFISVESAKNRARASMVLGEIGDARALPALQRLKNSTDNDWLLPYVVRAIAKISKSAKHKR